MYDDNYHIMRAMYKIIINFSYCTLLITVWLEILTANKFDELT